MILLNDIYVDDVLSGSDTISRAVQMRNQLISALQSAGMELRKWSSNTPELLQSIPTEYHSFSASWQLNEDQTVKTLATKRSVLATIARIFDPLGFLNPITIAAKIILKEIWSTKIKRQDEKHTGLEWDEELPSTLAILWQNFVAELPNIENISIPRWLNYTLRPHSMEIHSFCEGSLSAYAAAVYLRIQYQHGEIHTHLITSKAKVTPQNLITIPRVELCGAVLATTVAKWAQQHLQQRCGEIPIYYWTDATIVLHWIAGDIHRWKLYVANRVAKILSVSLPSQWSHVKTQDNPADCATRGLTPTQLQQFDLWWIGPAWLRQDKSTWPISSSSPDDIDSTATEEKLAKVLALSIITEPSFLLRYSSYIKLVRITARLLRFFYNLRKTRKEDRHSGPLTTNELQQSLFRIVHMVQCETFGSEIRCIKSKINIPTTSKLVSLTPFLDGNVTNLR
ncbi:uncharacterized protein LOC118753654 [Rhagoletis pomonella]|uniref:uncharacterized protein LOC118753654 n=1 Tax=Rhagoletis pomonella TaxID=28610 RepID=UPI001784F002|nr:uncharacterized protein LOC118753654 [Rhagoletis pomonella]